MSFSSHFFVHHFGWQKLRKTEVLRNSFFSSWLSFFVNENILQKITKTIFFLGNFVNQNEKWKMGWIAQKLLPKVLRFNWILKLTRWWKRFCLRPNSVQYRVESEKGWETRKDQIWKVSVDPILMCKYLTNDLSQEP